MPEPTGVSAGTAVGRGVAVGVGFAVGAGVGLGVGMGVGSGAGAACTTSVAEECARTRPTSLLTVSLTRMRLPTSALVSL